MKRIMSLFIAFLIISMAVALFSGCDNIDNITEKAAATEIPEPTKNLVIIYSGGKPVHFWITGSKVYDFSKGEVSIVTPEIDMYGTIIIHRNIKINEIRKMCEKYGLKLGADYEDGADYDSSQ